MSRRHRPSIVAIGGGTGLSTLLRGLKSCDADITAIVAVTDDGGGSGILRRELGMLPPGDIRNCLLALANAEPIMEQMMNYRFKEGSLAGQSLGNLFLAALNDLQPSFDKAVSSMSEVLAITGRVLPATNDNIRLLASFDNNAAIEGETSITEYKKTTNAVIRRMQLLPADVRPLPEALDAIDRADLIVMGPGSLYTSILPNLLIPELARHIAESDALKLYVCNIMTQDGETEGYTASSHALVLFEQTGLRLFDHMLLNSGEVPPDAIQSYRGENAVPVVADEDTLRAMNIIPVYADVSTVKNSFVRHDPPALAAAIMSFYRENASTRVYG